MMADAAEAAAAAAAAAATAGPSKAPMLRTTFRQQASFEPSYTGGATTALTQDGRYFIAPVNDVIHLTAVESGATVARIPSDMEDVTALCLSPDQATLVVASRSLALRLFALHYPTPTAANDDDKEEEEGESERVTWTLQRTIAKTHDAPIAVMQIDPTSTLVATGSSDTCAKVWDLRGGYCTHVFRGHGGIVSSVTWNMPTTSEVKNPNRPSSVAARQIELLTGSIDGRVRVWDLKLTGAAGAKPTAVLNAHFSVVRGVALSADGRRLVTAGRDRMVCLWERRRRTEADTMANGKAKGAWQLLQSLTAGEALESAGFLDDGDTFWTAGAEGEIRLWSFARQAIVRLQPGGRFARGLAKKRAALKSDDDEEEDGVEEEDENETRAVTEVHWLRQVNTLATVHADQDVLFRSCETLVRTRQLAGFNDQIIDAVLLSPGKTADSHLAVATNSTFVRVYTLADKQHTIDVLPSETDDADRGHTGLILCLDKTSDGKWLASGGKDRTVRVWAWVPRQAFAGLNAINGSDDEDDEMGVPVDGKVNGTGSSSSDEAYGWSCVAIAEGHTESVGAVAFARRPIVPDQAGAPFLVTGSQDRTAKVWDLSTLPQHIIKHFTPAGRREPLNLAALTTLKIHDKDINALDVSPNNALLLSGSQDKTVKIHALQYRAPSKANGQTAAASLKLIKTCTGHKRGVWSVAFSPSDAVFLTGSSDRTMKLWSINEGFTCVKNYVGHANSVLRVRFLKGAGGLQCLSCASDGLVKVWNVRTEECLDTLDGHEERVWGLDCSQSGAMLVSGGADGMIRFWHDWTARSQAEQLSQRQHDVEQEQAFGNLLVARDYRNAISLALAMQQPRRLFELFRTVDQQRKHGGGDASNATGALLRDALQGGGDDARKHGASLRDPALAQVLARAGVLPSSTLLMTQPSKEDDDETTTAAATSITGLTAVDKVVADLTHSQLATLLTFVRDWNTTVRTANVAQTVLHAVLRYHKADAIIAAFDARKNGGLGGGDGGGEDDGDGAVVPVVARGRRTGKEGADADLGNVLDALLPYTRRHYDRAQRILTESAMLEYTLANMDALLGPDDEEEGAARMDLDKVNGHADEASDEEEEQSDESDE